MLAQAALVESMNSFSCLPSADRSSTFRVGYSRYGCPRCLVKTPLPAGRLAVHLFSTGMPMAAGLGSHHGGRGRSTALRSSNTSRANHKRCIWFQAAVLMTEALVTLRDLGYEACYTVMFCPVLSGEGFPCTRASGFWVKQFGASS